MYTVVCGKYEGFTYDDSDELVCEGISEVDGVICEMRAAGYRIFLVKQDGEIVARIDDIAAAIRAQVETLNAL